ncbi:MAG: ADP-ribosylation factor-like protein [Candidatus Hodarchaeales archaeon]|jgi:GTPase SAR1 family protein
MILKVWVKVFNEVFEYSNTNSVIIEYEPALRDESHFQCLHFKEHGAVYGYSSIRVTLVLTYDYPKSSYLARAKLICDEVMEIRDKGLAGTDLDSFINKRIPQIIFELRNSTQLRFSRDYKLKNVSFNRTKPILIGVFGLDKAGKTTIMEYISSGREVKNYFPTLGHNRFILTGILGVEWAPIFLEVGGKAEFQPLWQDYDSLDGILFILDSGDKHRLNEVKKVFEDLINLDWNKSIPIALLANKQDLFHSLSLTEIRKTLDFDKSDQNKKIFPVSAISGEGFPRAFYWLLKEVVDSIQE